MEAIKKAIDEGETIEKQLSKIKEIKYIPS